MKNMSFSFTRIVVAIFAVVIAANMSAQALRTGYFLKGNIFRYRLNPALMSERGHFSIPILGGVDVKTMGNVGMSDFLYDSPLNSDELVTFMHSSVDADEFLSGLESDNTLNLNLDMTLFSAAFHAFGGFNTIDLTLRSNTGVSLPYDMFRFMKQMDDEHYSLSDMRMQTRNFADLSLGHSRKIDENLTVGARVKALFGLGYADAVFDKMDIAMSGDKWEIAAQGRADIALGGAYTLSDEMTISGKPMIDGYDDVSVGLHGFGMGVDLGVEYDFSELLLNGLSVSASLTDLGFIKWSGAARAAIEPGDSYVFDGFDNMQIHNGDNTLDEQWEGMRDDLEDFFALEDKGEGSVSTGLGAKLNIAAQYTMPFYKRMSVGALYTHCFDDVFSYNQASLMVNVSPLNVLDFAVSGTVGDRGAGFGALANLHCKGFAFFIGTDCFLGKVGKQFIPLENMDASVSFGVNIALGKAKSSKL